MASDSIFSDKVVTFGGDFQQMLPIIPRRSHSDIVHVTLNASIYGIIVIS